MLVLMFGASGTSGTCAVGGCALLWLGVVLGSQDDKDERVLIGSVAFTTAEVEAILAFSPLPPIPDDLTNGVYTNEAAARLGQALFFETRLSSNGAVSCATCHAPTTDWSDGKTVGEGIAAVTRNTPSLWNAAYNRWFFWDGSRDSLWSQALVPIENPKEHGFSRLEVVHFLADHPDYLRAYEDVFGPMPDVSDRDRFPAAALPSDVERDPRKVAWNGMTEDDRRTANRVFSNAGKAIAAFERKLISDGSPFDEFAIGLRDKDAYRQRSITDSAKRGVRLFLGKARCHLCHTGPNFTDREFHDTRIDAPNVDGMPDIGRFQGIKDVQADPFNGVGEYSDDPTGEADAKVSYLFIDGHAVREFKTPTLRNVAMTAPYMHHGGFRTLADVIDYYSTLERAADRNLREKILAPIGLTGREKDDLQDFLESLSGQGIDRALMRAPPKPFLDQ